ncbi:hypothetical protein SAMD00023353_3200950 [Rosellinia necatrix]|uniref:DUF676 domain-containing protein n=1 Tax=Rosellinia necatrix TaxID=77044 RepID=A0A1W2TIN9_ROSNE|nr:hypothetical protein SAMD00023353_3200950 [Rosellinia necatrix]
MPMSDLFRFSNPIASGPRQGPTEASYAPNPHRIGQNFLKTLVDPSNANIDIVAVHGLNPLNKQSHAEDTWTSEGHLWLSEFLPKRVPQARICLFGYNSNVAFGSSAAGVREQGENILNHLEQIRADNPYRPLMFICHSLGGLIIKRALVHAKADATYNKIWRSTFGLVFFATPQQGGNHTGFGDVLASIARCVSRSPANTFMAALKGNSTFLSTITDDFRQMLEDFQILSFYETRPLGSLGIVVDRKSALLGLPGTRERQIPIDADHRGICKFASSEDPRYRLVEDNIAQMVMNVTSPASHQRGNDEEELSDDAGNTSHITGEDNAINQAGHTNESITNGNGNRTDQFGHRNKCQVDGMSNTTTQVSLEATGVLLLGLKLILDRWAASGKDIT